MNDASGFISSRYFRTNSLVLERCSGNQQTKVRVYQSHGLRQTGILAVEIPRFAHINEYQCGNGMMSILLLMTYFLIR